jgi:hypothetical protein
MIRVAYHRNGNVEEQEYVDADDFYRDSDTGALEVSEEGEVVAIYAPGVWVLTEKNLWEEAE